MLKVVGSRRDLVLISVSILKKKQRTKSLEAMIEEEGISQLEAEKKEKVGLGPSQEHY